MRNIDLEKGQLLKRKEDGVIVTVIKSGTTKVEDLGYIPTLSLLEENGEGYCMNLRSWEHFYEKIEPA